MVGYFIVGAALRTLPPQLVAVGKQSAFSRRPNLAVPATGPSCAATATSRKALSVDFMSTFPRQIEGAAPPSHGGTAWRFHVAATVARAAAPNMPERPSGQSSRRKMPSVALVKPAR